MLLTRLHSLKVADLHSNARALPETSAATVDRKAGCWGTGQLKTQIAYNFSLAFSMKLVQLSSLIQFI